MDSCVVIYFNLRAVTFVAIVVKTTILMELKGINMAATTGSSRPVTAKETPTTLYINDSTKLHFTILMADFDKLIKSLRLLNLTASKIASHAGEKTLTFSEIAMPTLLWASAPASFSPSPIIKTLAPSL